MASRMSRMSRTATPSLKWQLEALGYSLVEGMVARLPVELAFRFGELLGLVAWLCMPRRRAIVARNLRIALAGDVELHDIPRLVRANFRRTGANMISASLAANLPFEEFRETFTLVNSELLDECAASGRGTILLLSHMGNWEILARMSLFFPPGLKGGAFYRPLNNPILNERVLRRREQDGVRMFSKRDSLLQITSFLRDGNLIGILADQRVGIQGEPTVFFGRATRSSPLPALLARRAKCNLLSLSLVTTSPGHWKATLSRVDPPITTDRAMASLEAAMRSSIIDVFWMQERWKTYISPHRPPDQWLADADPAALKPLRALIWPDASRPAWQPAANWFAPGIRYEIAVLEDSPVPVWADKISVQHGASVQSLHKIDRSGELPLDFILSPAPSPALLREAARLAIPVVTLP